jgi:hypothetical protein
VPLSTEDFAKFFGSKSQLTKEDALWLRPVARLANAFQEKPPPDLVHVIVQAPDRGEYQVISFCATGKCVCRSTSMMMYFHYHLSLT